MRLGSFIIFYFHISLLSAYAKEPKIFEHFKSCNEPSLIVTNAQRHNLTKSVETDFYCEMNSPLPSLGAMDDFIEEYSEHTIAQRTRLSLLSEANKRIKLAARANLSKLKLQKKCFDEPNLSGCQELITSIKQGISSNWHNMNLGLVLGFQENTAIRYQFGADKPDLFQFPKTKHPFGGRVTIDNSIRKEAQDIFEKKRQQLGDHIDSGLRDEIQSTYRNLYTNALNNAPIMALVNSNSPSDKEISVALSEMIENNQELLEEDFDAKELAGFFPVIENLVLEDPRFCQMAEHLINQKLESDKNNRYLQLGAAGALGVGCLASAWTGVGLGLCFSASALMTGTNLSIASSDTEFERNRSFTSALNNELMADFESLSSAEQRYALELLMAPAAGLGAGSFLRTVAPTTRVVKFMDKAKASIGFKTSALSAATTEEMTETGAKLQEIVSKVKASYREADEVSVCGINVSSYACRDNTQELIRYARVSYPDFDMSKARVIKIEAPEYVPLYANNATRPQGYTATTTGGVKEHAKKVRTAESGATTWSRHYVLEYEGRIYDFDFAEDAALTTREYIQSQFSDVVNGVVRPSTSNQYKVKIIDAEEFADSTDISVFDIRGANQGSFLEFIDNLP